MELQLKASELRIGNWLQYTNNHSPTQYFQVESIWGTAVNIVSDIRYSNFGNAEPVPLTPDILEKAGFDVSDGYYRKKIRGLHLFILPGKDCHIDGENIVFIEHLHQLQNLYFALTGEELQITLS